MRTNVGDFVINYLAHLGIKDMFMVYGAANAGLVDAFTRTKDVRYITVMHEQAGGFMAEGYAKVSRLPGVCIATSGPGGMNLVTPIGNCYYDSVPCLFLTGQIRSEFLRSDPAIRQVGFQETDIVGIVSPITKYAKMVKNARDIKFELEKALYIAQEGRPGPVLLDIPINIQNQEIETDELQGFDAGVATNAYDLDDIHGKVKSLINDIYRCRRPVILVGGGVWIANAVDLLRTLVKRLGIPCLPTFNAFDVITSDFELYGGRVGTFGSRPGNFTIQNSDLLLAIGSRISGRITGGNLATFARAAKKYVVDVDPALLQRSLQQVPFDVNIHCDAKLFLNLLCDALRERTDTPDFSGWTNIVLGWKRRFDVMNEGHCRRATKNINPYRFMNLLSKLVGKNDVFVGDCGGNIVIASQAFETKYGQRFITNNGNSPMGFSFAGAMGAWFASDRMNHTDDHSKRNVICLIGDGGFNMNIQELQTCVNYNVGMKVLILNNQIYGITKAFQKINYGGRNIACGPDGYKPPDFMKICDAYGIATETIRDESEITSKVQSILDADHLVVCDVVCPDWHAYGPKVIGWKTPIEDMYPYLPREEFKKLMLIDLVPGWEQPFMPPVADLN